MRSWKCNFYSISKHKTIIHLIQQQQGLSHAPRGVDYSLMVAGKQTKYLRTAMEFIENEMEITKKRRRMRLNACYLSQRLVAPWNFRLASVLPPFDPLLRRVAAAASRLKVEPGTSPWLFSLYPVLQKFSKDWSINRKLFDVNCPPPKIIFFSSIYRPPQGISTVN